MQADRVVQPELLDHLDPTDRHAIRSRADLRRLHRIMGTRGILLQALRRVPHPPHPPRRILELGAGDGTLMLRLARKLAAHPARESSTWRDVRIALLDQHPVVSRRTVRDYAQAGWHAVPLQTDVQSFLGSQAGWLEAASSHPAEPERYHLVVANLFLHHFPSVELRTMLAGVAARCDAFIACEPSRSAWALFASRLVGLVGANAITREDAVLSVRAGFHGVELSALWPSNPGWQTFEYSAGPFSHCFVACRNPAGRSA